MANDHDNKSGNQHPQFKILVNNVEFTTNEHQLTGAQIKSLAGVPSDYELFEVRGDQTVPVGNDDVVHIHNNMHFRAIPAGTFGLNDTTAQVATRA